jgi:hypothetical protein
MKNLFIAITALFVIGIIACRKHYAEDDSYTLRSPYHRLTNGKWVIQKVEIDGQDSTLAYFNETNFGITIEFGTRNENCKFYVKSSKWLIYPLNPIRGIIAMPSPVCSYGDPGITSWDFDSDQSAVIMNDFMICPYTTKIDSNKNPPFITYVFNKLSYIIVKLTNKELILETEEKNKHFRFFFLH